MRRHSLRRPSRGVQAFRHGAIAICVALSGAVILPVLARADAREGVVSYVGAGGGPAFPQP